MKSRLRRLCLPWRNRLYRLCPALQRAISVTDFTVRHLPRLARRGWSAPMPPLLKRAFLRGIAKGERARNLVETGTYLGDTSWEYRNDFMRIDSIEVEPYLYEQATHRFRGMPHVTIHLGDSGSVLPSVIPTLQGKTLYWLDGHYSAGITGAGESHCPVVAELEAIFTLSKDSFVIVIDDARCFGTDPAYPTIGAIQTQVASLSHSRAAITVENDMIIIRLPPEEV